MLGRAEIDRRAPFKSVKEAVTMFGNKVLAGEVYTSKLRAGTVSYDNEHADSFRSVTVDAMEELEQTRWSLLKAREESVEMERSLSLLKQDLETTNRELRQLRRENRCRKKPATEMNDDEVEDLKFTEEKAEVTSEIQKKRYVMFEAPVAVVERSLMDPQGVVEGEAVLKRHPSLRKKIKKPLFPLIFRGIFTRKSARSQDTIKAFDSIQAVVYAVWKPLVGAVETLPEVNKATESVSCKTPCIVLMCRWMVKSVDQMTSS